MLNCNFQGYISVMIANLLHCDLLCQACSDQRSKPPSLTDKNLESGIKFIVRKFPQVDIRSNQVFSLFCKNVFLLGLEIN